MTICFAYGWGVNSIALSRYLCPMAYRSLRAFIDALEQAGELVRIKTFVDPKLEIAEITDRISKTPDRNKAL